MEVTQIADIVNQTTLEVTGNQDLASTDLNKVVEVGREVIDTDDDKMFDNYTKKLIDRIGKVVFVNRPYTGSTPSVMMDSWEYGAILEKIQYEGLPRLRIMIPGIWLMVSLMTLMYSTSLRFLLSSTQREELLISR